jgi:hypothetical protein
MAAPNEKLAAALEEVESPIELPDRIVSSPR